MSRKERLKKIVLNNRCYDIEIYRIIDSGILDSIIPKLRKKPIIYYEENKFVDFDEHIVMLLHNFIHFFKSNFRDLCPYFDYVFKCLLRENSNLFLNYLNEGKFVNSSDNFNFYALWNCKLSIANFVKNTYFSSVKKLFDDNNISIKEINKYSDEEIKNIFDILKGIVNSSTIDVALPFDNVYVYAKSFNISENVRTNIFMKFDELFSELFNSSNLNDGR